MSINGDLGGKVAIKTGKNRVKKEVENIVKTSNKENLKIQDVKKVFISPIQLNRMAVTIVGDTPLIISNFWFKKRRELLHTYKGGTVPRHPKNPEAEFEGGTYYIDEKFNELRPPSTKEVEKFREESEDQWLAMNRWALDRAETIENPKFGFPSSGVVGASKRGVKYIGGVMKDFGCCFSIPQSFIPIYGIREMREDMVRLANGSPDVRFRPCWYEWWSEFIVQYNSSVYTAESILNSINSGGFSSGLGEWRKTSPKAPGPNGQFHVATEKESKILKK